MIGWINLYKPEGISSAQAVGCVKRFLRDYTGEKVKIGHAGTLDPLASGVLPLAVGEATKTVPYVMADEKAYAFTIHWGQATETDDREGEVVETHEHRPSESEIKAILQQFTGDIQQTPPAYSAIKVDGKRAYALARAGEEVTLSARPIQIHTLSLESIDDADYATFACRCGKGTYIRSLARDIALALGTVGHVSMLTRTAVGKFSLQNAISLDFFEKTAKNTPENQVGIPAWLTPVETVLDDILAIHLEPHDYEKLRHGQTFNTKELHHADMAALIFRECLVGFGEVARGNVKSKRLIHRPELNGK